MIRSIIRSVLFWGICIGLLFLASSQMQPLLPSKWYKLTYGIAGTCCALLTTWLFLKIQKGSCKAIGLGWQRRTFIRFLKGVAIGTVLFTVMLFVLVSFSALQFQRNPVPFNIGAFAITFLTLIPLALMEELAFRSYSFVTLNKDCGLWITQILTAIAFALYHVAGGQSVSSSFLGPGIWAFVFGLAAVWSGGIAMPLGIHFTINVLQVLAGMKGSINGFWTLSYPEGTTQTMIARTDTVGVVIHIALLAVAFVLTYKAERSSSP